MSKVKGCVSESEKTELLKFVMAMDELRSHRIVTFSGVFDFLRKVFRRICSSFTHAHCNLYLSNAVFAKGSVGLQRLDAELARGAGATTTLEAGAPPSPSVKDTAASSRDTAYLKGSSSQLGVTGAIAVCWQGR